MGWAVLAVGCGGRWAVGAADEVAVQSMGGVGVAWGRVIEGVSPERTFIAVRSGAAAEVGLEGWVVDSQGEAKGRARLVEVRGELGAWTVESGSAEAGDWILLPPGAP